MVFGIPREFLSHGKRADILEAIGLGAQSLARDITARVAGLDRSDASSRRTADNA
jgi:hypothetical protein